MPHCDECGFTGGAEDMARCSRSPCKHRQEPKERPPEVVQPKAKKGGRPRITKPSFSVDE